MRSGAGTVGQEGLAAKGKPPASQVEAAPRCRPPDQTWVHYSCQPLNDHTFTFFQLSLSTELGQAECKPYLYLITPLLFPYLQKYKLVLSQPMHRQTEWPIGWYHHCNDQLKSLVVLFLIAHQGPDFRASFRPDKPVLNILALIWVSAVIFKCSCAQFFPQTAIMTSGPPLHVPAAQNGHYA